MDTTDTKDTAALVNRLHEISVEIEKLMSPLMVSDDRDDAATWAYLNMAHTAIRCAMIRTEPPWSMPEEGHYDPDRAAELHGERGGS